MMIMMMIMIMSRRCGFMLTTHDSPMTHPCAVRRPRVQAGMEGYDGFVGNLILLQDSAWVCWFGWFASLLIVSARLHNMRMQNAMRAPWKSMTPQPPGGNRTEDAVSHPSRPAPASRAAPSKPSVWEAVKDEGSGDTYYYNSQTEVTTWDKPADF